MLNVAQKRNLIHAETATAILEWDLTRGGQLTKFSLKSERGIREVLVGDVPAPNLTLEMPGRCFSVADVPAKARIIRKKKDRFTFATTARLDGIFTFEQEFDLFPEGGLFCEMGLFLDKEKTAKIRNAEMRFSMDVMSARNVLVNWISRDVLLKQDVTCIHVLATQNHALPRTESIDEPYLLPFVGLDLGWEDSRYFSHKFEMIIEDCTSIGGQMKAPVRTVAGPKDGRWELVWKLCEDSSERLTGPFLYRNRWGLFFGAARTGAGAKTDPARRNNLLGSRVCHVMYPYVRKGDEWPWGSVPVRQTFYQDAQIAKENPPLKRVDEAAKCGANVLILHQFWMRQAGSNGEPMADYQVNDPKWFKAFVGLAHKHCMRVLLYMRCI